MTDLYFVTVDTRGMSSSDIRGYKEHTSSFSYFRNHIAGHPDTVCYRSKVAKLCGLDLKIYFKEDHGCNARGNASTAGKRDINRAASLLTLDPETGMAEHRVQCVAYVVLNDGVAPLSLNQVWGIQELINYAKDVYKSDPDHERRGRKDLLKSCKLYRHREWGPLSIYQSRPEVAYTVAPHSVMTSKDGNRTPFRQIQTY